MRDDETRPDGKFDPFYVELEIGPYGTCWSSTFSTRFTPRVCRALWCACVLWAAVEAASGRTANATVVLAGAATVACVGLAIELRQCSDRAELNHAILLALLEERDEAAMQWQE